MSNIGKSLRIPWEVYALKIAQVAAERSEDPWCKVGCCLLRRDNSVAALGYNGAPPGIEIDWSDRDARRKRVIHAECNALRYVRPGEVRLCATTISPCADCVKALASYGVEILVFSDFYVLDPFGLELAAEFDMKTILVRNIS